jgi:Family of unknown function (DUF6544)
MIGEAMCIQRKLSREVARMGLVARGEPGPGVREADLAPLPPAAQRYLRYMGVLGRPRDTTFRIHLRGEFRMNDRSGWLPIEAWQYSSQPDVARIFHMTLRMKGIPVYGRDTYFAGHGRMLVRPLDLFTIEDGHGPEYDLGELVTYLNDGVFIAPSMLLAPGITFSAVDDRSFDVAITSRGVTATARVLLDDGGAPRDFSTDDRFCSQNPFDPKQRLVRARWTTPVDGFVRVDGRAFPTRGKAVWHLPQGEFTYAVFDFDPAGIAFNVPPGA